MQSALSSNKYCHLPPSPASHTSLLPAPATGRIFALCLLLGTRKMCSDFKFLPKRYFLPQMSSPNFHNLVSLYSVSHAACLWPKAPSWHMALSLRLKPGWVPLIHQPPPRLTGPVGRHPSFPVEVPASLPLHLHEAHKAAAFVPLWPSCTYCFLKLCFPVPISVFSYRRERCLGTLQAWWKASRSEWNPGTSLCL